MKVIVTKHASERFAERCGITIKAGTTIDISKAVNVGKDSSGLRDVFVLITKGIALVVDSNGKLVTLMTEGNAVRKYVSIAKGE